MIALLAILVLFVLISLVLVFISPLNTVESETILAFKSVESDLNLVTIVSESFCSFNKLVLIVEVLILIRFLNNEESIFCLFKFAAISVVLFVMLFSLEAILDARVKESVTSFARLFAIFVFAVLIKLLNTFESATILA